MSSSIRRDLAVHGHFICVGARRPSSAFASSLQKRIKRLKTPLSKRSHSVPATEPTASRPKAKTTHKRSQSAKKAKRKQDFAMNDKDFGYVRVCFCAWFTERMEERAKRSNATKGFTQINEGFGGSLLLGKKNTPSATCRLSSTQVKTHH